MSNTLSTTETKESSTSTTTNNFEVIAPPPTPEDLHIDINDDEQYIKKRGRPKSKELEQLREDQNTNMITIKTLYRTLTRKQKKILLTCLLTYI